MKADSTDKERLRPHIMDVLKQLKSHLDAKPLKPGQQAAQAGDKRSKPCRSGVRGASHTKDKASRH